MISDWDDSPLEARSYRWLLWLMAGLVFLGDQTTKLAVQRALGLWEAWRPFTSFPLDQLAIRHVSNRGAAFGVMQEYGGFFILVALVVSGAITWYYRRLPPDQWPIFVSLGLQLGGALGNLSDRLRLGYVVDFIEVSILPVFNIADTAIVMGVLLLALHFGREEPSPRSVPDSSANPHRVGWSPLRFRQPSRNGHKHLNEDDARRLIQGGDNEFLEPPL